MLNYQGKYDKRAFNINEAAEYACVSRGTIENWLNKGLIPYEELPSRGKGLYHYRRIRKKDLDDFLNKFYLKYHITQPDNKKESKELTKTTRFLLKEILGLTLKPVTQEAKITPEIEEFVEGIDADVRRNRTDECQNEVERAHLSRRPDCGSKSQQNTGRSQD